MWLSCSSNGSSLGQWARAERADGRITSKRMRGADVLTRAILRPVATGRRTPAWPSFSSLPSRTIRKIQGATRWLFAMVAVRKDCRPDGAAEWGGAGGCKDFAPDGAANRRPLHAPLGVPRTIFGVPETIFGVPQTTFGAPETIFDAPEITFGSPEMRFGSPEVILENQIGTLFKPKPVGTG